MAVQDLTTYIASLGPAFDPQVKNQQDQIDAIPGQVATAKQGVEAAKTNAFKQIDNGANRRNMLFSGVPIDEQYTYTGEKYAPALAGIEDNANSARYKLIGSINDINSQRYTSALNQRNTDVANENSLNEQKRQFDTNVALQRETNASNASRSTGSSGAAATTPAQDFRADLNKLFSGFNDRPKGYTEAAVLPALLGEYLDNGFTRDQIVKMMYDYRKQVYGQ